MEHIPFLFIVFLIFIAVYPLAMMAAHDGMDGADIFKDKRDRSGEGR